MFVTTEQVAERARVSREYIARLCREGGIEATKPGGRDWLIADEEAERWLEERESGHKMEGAIKEPCRLSPEGKGYLPWKI